MREPAPLGAKRRKPEVPKRKWPLPRSRQDRALHASGTGKRRQEGGLFVTIDGVDRAKIKDASASLIEQARTAATRGVSLASERFEQVSAKASALEQRLDHRTAPARDTAGRLGRKLATILAPVTRPIRALLGKIAPFIAWVPVGIAALLAFLLSSIASAIERLQRAYRYRLIPALSDAVDFLSQRLTPTLIAAVCAVIASGLLIGSQFLEYRGVAVGAPLYKGEIAVDAPAPITATAIAGDAHFWVMIPIALVAALASLVAARRGNRTLALAVSALGAAAVVVTLAVDLPKGLDPVYALPYSDAVTRLLGGFWAELFSALALFVSGVMLARGDTPRRAIRRVRQPSPGSDLAAAGGL